MSSRKDWFWEDYNGVFSIHPCISGATDNNTSFAFYCNSAHLAKLRPNLQNWPKKRPRWNSLIVKWSKSYHSWVKIAPFCCLDLSLKTQGQVLIKMRDWESLDPAIFIHRRQYSKGSLFTKKILFSVLQNLNCFFDLFGSIHIYLPFL